MSDRNAVWVVEWQSGRSRITGEPLWSMAGAYTMYMPALEKKRECCELRRDVKFRVRKYVPAKRSGR